MKLLQGDCLELMKYIPDGSVDMILCDPPYGIDFQSSWKKNKADRFPKIMNDKTPFTSFIQGMGRVLKMSGCAMIFTRWDVQQSFIDALNTEKLPPRNVLIWDKRAHGMGDLRRTYGSRYESILFSPRKDFVFNGQRPVDIISVSRVPAAKLVHPNEKPVELLETLIRQCAPEGGVVLDMFMGSGSTGVACFNTGRDFIGMELDPGYFEIAQKRIGEAEARNLEKRGAKEDT